MFIFSSGSLHVLRAEQMAGMLTQAAAGAFPNNNGSGNGSRSSSGSGNGDSAAAAEGVGEEEGADEGRPVLYVSGEESVEQIGGRAERMGIGANSSIFVYR